MEWLMWIYPAVTIGCTVALCHSIRNCKLVHGSISLSLESRHDVREMGRILRDVELMPESEEDQVRDGGASS